ncbi:MAG: pilus assembly protein PilM [Acidobacteriia bacterium]|nr:pilus assembly protein PilM [Terriglobia bacterium]
MFGLGKTKGLVGLDIGSSAVKAVELKKKGAEYELVNLGMEGLGQDTVVDGAIMDSFTVANAIEKIFVENKIKTKSVATAVSGHSVIVKKISVNAPSEAEVAAAMPYEAQQYIPFDMADVNLSYEVLAPATAGPGFDVMLVAVKRDKILNHTNVLSQAGKVPMVVDIDAFAMQNAFEVNYEPSADRMIALLNIGASIMNINIVRGGVPLFTRDVSVGGTRSRRMRRPLTSARFPRFFSWKCRRLSTSSVRPPRRRTSNRSTSRAARRESKGSSTCSKKSSIFRSTL